MMKHIRRSEKKDWKIIWLSLWYYVVS